MQREHEYPFHTNFFFYFFVSHILQSQNSKLSNDFCFCNSREQIAMSRNIFYRHHDNRFWLEIRMLQKVKIWTSPFSWNTHLYVLYSCFMYFIFIRLAIQFIFIDFIWMLKLLLKAVALTSFLFYFFNSFNSKTLNLLEVNFTSCNWLCERCKEEIWRKKKKTRICGYEVVYIARSHFRDFWIKCVLISMSPDKRYFFYSQ